MAHIHETMDFTAEVFIVYKNTVLLRMHDKYKFWCSVGGHIEVGEDPNEAALREVKEEVGLDVVLWDAPQRFTTIENSFRNLVPPVGLNRHQAGERHEHVTFVYFATSKTDAVRPEHPDDEWKWATREDLARMDLRTNIREYAEAALGELAE